MTTPDRDRDSDRVREEIYDMVSRAPAEHVRRLMCDIRATRLAWHEKPMAGKA